MNATDGVVGLDRKPILSKVIIHDDSEQAVDALKGLCDTNRLIGIRSLDADIINFMLDPIMKNSDVGALFLMEGYDKNGLSGISIATKVKKVRKDLPIILRMESGRSLKNLDEDEASVFAASYTMDDQNELVEVVQRYLFNVYYPLPIVETIGGASEQAIKSIFKSSQVVGTVPFLVRDHLITDDITCMINVEASWAQGYMIVQANEADIDTLYKREKAGSFVSSTEQYTNSEVLAELTNMLSGKIRASCVDGTEQESISMVQLPITFNKKTHQLSFGSKNPQLCYRFILSDAEGESAPIEIQVKSIFHIRWDPDAFSRANLRVNREIDEGGLEFLT